MSGTKHGGWFGGGGLALEVRAYFAPANWGGEGRAPTVFDAAQWGTFALDTPPAPWVPYGVPTTLCGRARPRLEC